MSQRFALIIGNSEYADPKLPGLATPAEDARALSEVLSDPQIGGFDEVPTLINESDSTVRKAIERFFARRRADDLLLLYFSGHGVLDDQGRLYLAVRDTEYDLLSASAVPAAFITDNMDRTQSKRQVLILDCCHSGAFFKGTKTPTETKAVTESTFRGRGYGKVVLTATDTTQYAWEHDQRVGFFENSIFTHFLIEGLKTGKADLDQDGEISVDELYDYVYGELVTRKSRQTPHRWSYKQQGKITIARSLLGSRSPRLSSELLQTLEDSRPYVREGGVRELGRLLHDRDSGVVHSAETVLARIATDDDSRLVSKLATDLLDAHRLTINETQISQLNHDIESENTEAKPSLSDVQREALIQATKKKRDNALGNKLKRLFYGFQSWTARRLASVKELVQVRPHSQLTYLERRSKLFAAIMSYRRYLLVASLLLLTVTVSVFGYYWTLFSSRIDNLRETALIIPSCGIYAAPKTVRVGDSIPIEEFNDYLDRAGYTRKSQDANPARGQYLREERKIEVIPSQNGDLGKRGPFPHVRIYWSTNLTNVSFIDDANDQPLNEALLEPVRIGSARQNRTEELERRLLWVEDLPAYLVNGLTVVENRNLGGAKPISEQIINDLLLTPTGSIRYRLTLAYMALVMKARLSRREILQVYSNQVRLGGYEGKSIRGFGTAARFYFGKEIRSVTLAESAFLIGKIGNPDSDFKTANEIAHQVLDAMAEEGAITHNDAVQAKSQPLTLAPANNNTVADEFFTDYVQAQLGDMVANSGSAETLRIYTTIDMDLQKAAYTALMNQVAALDKIHPKRSETGTLQAVLVAMKAQTGEIVSMVGGRDYSKNQLNRATVAYRQPGSVFKPFVYATALNTAYDPVPRVITPATTYMDEPKTFTLDNQEYPVKNLGERYSHAPVTLREAFVRSINVVTVEAALEVTIGRVMNLAAKAGLPKPPRAYPQMALGTSEASPLQIASAYTTFANLGNRTTPMAINQLTTGNGAIIASPTTQTNEVLRPDVAYVMTSFMKDTVDRGTAKAVRDRGFQANVAGQTGTSVDGWFVGYTPNLVCVVWVGFDDGSELGLTGANSALPIWTDFMQVALRNHPEWAGDWRMPEGIEQIGINPLTGARTAKGSSLRRIELFIKGTLPNSTVETPEELATETPPESRASPSPTARFPPTPSPSPRLEGTITLDIDPVTGLIAVESCPIIRTKTFVLGTQPTKYCGPEYHRKRSSPTPH